MRRYNGPRHRSGSALRVLGERENSTARLQEAVGAYREALKEDASLSADMPTAPEREP